VSLALPGNFERQHKSCYIINVIMCVCIDMQMYIHVHCHDRRLFYQHTELAMHKMLIFECSRLIAVSMSHSHAGDGVRSKQDRKR